MSRGSPTVEGTQVAVPLRRGWALGVVSRSDGPHKLLGYFFGPVLDDPPRHPAELTPRDARLIAQFSDLGIREGRWQAIGPTPQFTRAGWPVPTFGHIDDLVPGRGWRVRYDEQLHEIERASVPADTLDGLPDDGLYGATALERALERVISPDAHARPPPPSGVRSARRCGPRCSRRHPRARASCSSAPR
jgi:hypothetical protein